MRDQEIQGKKIFYREKELGKVINIRTAFSGHKKIAIVEVAGNSFKAVPLELIDSVADRLQFRSDQSRIDGFPKLTSRQIENSEKLEKSINEHYGDPKHWQTNNSDFDSSKGEAYMGSSQITDQEPSDNASVKEEMDYDQINRGKDESK